jgi:hypothetical protein
MHNFKKSLLIFLLFELLFSYTPVFAQTMDSDYSKAGVSAQIEKYLCSPNPVPASQTDLTNGIGTRLQDGGYQKDAAANNNNSGVLYQCINQMYKFAIVVASVMSVFFLVIAGYVYMSAEGNSESVEKAKSIMTSTIASLVILFAGFILLKAINPDLIQFHSIQPPSVTGVPVGGAPVVGGSCSGCQNYAGQLPFKSGTGTQLQPSLAAKLQTLNSVNQNWVISEGYPPTVQHSDPCHNNGSCVDVNIKNLSATNLNQLCQDMRTAGFATILNEYTQFNASAVPNCPAPKAYDTTTGGNLHIK